MGSVDEQISIDQKICHGKYFFLKGAAAFFIIVL